MELYLMNTAQGLKPFNDDDYEEKKRLKIGQIYKAKISVPRNYRFHKKYFSMINCAWDLQSEARQRFFKDDVHIFRKSVEIAAGHCDVAFNLTTRQWVEYPKSIAFDKMPGDEFELLYKKVREVLLKVFLTHITLEQFEETLLNY